MVDLEGKLKLEYYKLQKSFEGTITLQETHNSVIFSLILKKCRIGILGFHIAVLGGIAKRLGENDKDLHKEFVFCSYLLNLLPVEAVDMVDLEGKLKLEYYKLGRHRQTPWGKCSP